jgi:hypothetical protein
MLAIGALAKRTGTKVQTIRNYEGIGLMREPDCIEGGQPRHGDTDLDRLAFIRHARQLGFHSPDERAGVRDPLGPGSEQPWPRPARPIAEGGRVCRMTTGTRISTRNPETGASRSRSGRTRS